MTRMICLAACLLTACFSVNKLTTPPIAAPAPVAPPAVHTDAIAGMTNSAPVPVVPASEAPPMEQGGKGWHCFEFRASNREAGTRCWRTIEDCRVQAADKARSTGGSTSEPITYEVGSCSAQPQAFCNYLWSSIGPTGQYYCFGRMEECSQHQNSSWGGGVAKQTACEAKD